MINNSTTPTIQLKCTPKGLIIQGNVTNHSMSYSQTPAAQQASVAQPNGATEITRIVAQIKRHAKEHQPVSEELAALLETEISKLLQKDLAVSLDDLSKQQQDEAGMEAEARKFDAIPSQFQLSYGSADDFEKGLPALVGEKSPSSPSCLHECALFQGLQWPMLPNY